RATEDSYALKPRTTKVAAIAPRDDLESVDNKPYNLPADDFAGVFNNIIVHELLHSVGVYHHGGGDHEADFSYVPASYKGNNRGEPVLWMQNRWMKTTDAWNRDIDVLEEMTGVNWAKRISPAMDFNLDRICADNASTLEVPPGTKFADLDRRLQELVMNLDDNFKLQIGVQHGEHSGNEQCPMRYCIADVYKPKGSMQRETYYLVPKGTENIGVEICKDPKGTGVNDSERKPRSRYGDAYDTLKYYYGNCAGQICVNDAAPERPWGIAK
ncbi:MAG: hypothetical protein AB1649_28835, partial [Chloroflexota bacterium]